MCCCVLENHLKGFFVLFFFVTLQHLRSSEVLPASGQRKGKFPISSPLLTLPLWKRCWLTLGVPSRVAQEWHSALPRHQNLHLLECPAPALTTGT